MKFPSLLLFILLCGTAGAQLRHHVDVPQGVVYHYCDDRILDSAKVLITQELGSRPTYVLSGRILFLGPVLWTRFSKVRSLRNIQGGNVSNLVDGKVLAGKMTQSVEDSRLCWDALRAEIGKQRFELRLPTPQELRYYWSVISFEIEEPLIILSTKAHNYILNLSNEDYTLLWLDEAPR